MPELLDVHTGDVVHCHICFSLININSCLPIYLYLLSWAAILNR